MIHILMTTAIFVTLVACSKERENQSKEIDRMYEDYAIDRYYEYDNLDTLHYRLETIMAKAKAFVNEDSTDDEGRRIKAKLDSIKTVYHHLTYPYLSWYQSRNLGDVAADVNIDGFTLTEFQNNWLFLYKHAMIVSRDTLLAEMVQRAYLDKSQRKYENNAKQAFENYKKKESREIENTINEYVGYALQEKNIIAKILNSEIREVEYYQYEAITDLGSQELDPEILSDIEILPHFAIRFNYDVSADLKVEKDALKMLYDVVIKRDLQINEEKQVNVSGDLVIRYYSGDNYKLCVLDTLYKGTFSPAAYIEHGYSLNLGKH